MLTSTVTIPPAHNNDVISVALAQEGAVEIAYGIRLFLGGAENRPPLAPFPTSTPGRTFPMTAGIALRGLSLNCFGRIFLAEQEIVKLRCDFSVGAMSSLHRTSPSSKWLLRILRGRFKLIANSFEPEAKEGLMLLG